VHRALGPARESKGGSRGLVVRGGELRGGGRVPRLGRTLAPVSSERERGRTTQ
jgi:hypothetical protein